MRLFFALTLPGDIQRQVAEAIRPVVAATPSISWIPQDRLHLTLKFLGEVDQALVPRLASVGREAVNPIAPHSVLLEGVGAFPNLRRPRVVWLGMQRADAVCDIARHIEAGVAPLGMTRETRPFRPHVTLARVKGAVPGPELSLFEQGRRKVKLSLSCPVTHVALVRSTPGAGGSRYDVLEHFPLGGR